MRGRWVRESKAWLIFAGGNWPANLRGWAAHHVVLFLGLFLFSCFCRVCFFLFC